MGFIRAGTTVSGKWASFGFEPVLVEMPANGHFVCVAHRQRALGTDPIRTSDKGARKE